MCDRSPDSVQPPDQKKPTDNVEGGAERKKDDVSFSDNPPQAAHYPKDNANQTTDSNAKESRYGLEWWRTILEIVFFISAVPAAFFAAFAWYDSHEQLHEIQQSRMLDERAWVVLSEIKPTTLFTNINAGAIQVSFKSIGRTPALNVQTVVRLEQYTNDIPETDIMPNPPVNGGNYAPGQTGFIQTILVPPPIMKEFEKQRAFYIFGTIKYSDIFTSNHWTQFCYEIVPDPLDHSRMDFNPTPFHNSIGDANPAQGKN